VADNQQPVARALTEADAAIDAGELDAATAGRVLELVAALAADGHRRSELAGSGWHLVDGRGTSRVATRMMAAVVDLRSATMDDAERLLAWRNEAETRRWSFSSEEIGTDEHRAWLARRLADPGTQLLIAERDGAAIGQVRFDLDGDRDGTAEISVGLDPAARGRGLGAAVIAAGVERAFAGQDIGRVVARVKAANLASARAFLDADFDESEGEAHEGEEVRLYTRVRHAAGQ
jgi:RimJ/RimL family protein N-acetyltransferase